MKKTDNIDWLKTLQRVVFGIVLLVALGISWFSLMTLATDFFELPMWLSAVVSLAMDGAGIYAALLASAYAKTRHSGMIPRAATWLFVLFSAWLNWNHAEMSNLNFAGSVFYAAPSLMAGLLFDMMLTFENKSQLEKRGRIPEALPVLGRLAWMRYPKFSFETLSKVIRTRLESVSDTNETEKTPYDKKDIDLANKDMSITKLVQKMYLDGETDKTVIREAVSKIKGVNVPIGTVAKSIARIRA